jgi:Zn-dependent protease with chaperone function
MQQRVPTSSDQSINVRRWPSEIPLFIAVIVVSILLWIVITVATVGIGLVYALLIGLFFFFVHAGLVMHLRGSAIQLGPNQFPEIYNRVVELSATAGLKDTPDAYILQADGALNAFATKFFRGKIVTLYSDLLEACGDDRAARDMIIGHEIGHLRSGHLDWQVLTAPGRFVPFLGSAYSRACEYTCDRWGASLCGDPDGARRGLIVLAAGRTLSRSVNVDAYIAQQQKLDTGWMTLARWAALYPPLSARVDVLSTRPDARPYSTWKGPLRAWAILAAFVLVPVLVASSLPFLFQPILREFGGLGADFGSIVEPQSLPQDDGNAVIIPEQGPADAAPPAPSFASVEEMPAPQPAPVLGDARLNELAQQCQAGDMGACDNLFNETEVGSPEEQYANTCGQRIPDNTEDCASLISQ